VAVSPCGSTRMRCQLGVIRVNPRGAVDLGLIPKQRHRMCTDRQGRIPSESACDPRIPPRRNARLSAVKDPMPFKAVRDAVLRCIKGEGRYPRRTSSGATRQSLAENVVSRFKALVGIQLTSRRIDAQQVEAVVKCRVLNRMATLGMPKLERISVV